MGTVDQIHFHQESLDHKLAHSRRFPEDAFGMQIQMKVPRLNVAASARFFPGLAFGGLAVRDRRLRIALGKCPLAAAISIDQQKLDRIPLPPVANSSDLQWESQS